MANNQNGQLGNPTATVEELESIDNVYWAEQYEALIRLYDNPDFNKVIVEGYFKDRAVEGVSLLATQYIKQSGKRGELMETLVAISALEDHFATIKSMGAPIPEEDEE